MRCTGCFKELKEGDKAYATGGGSMESNPILNNEIGFYANDLEPFITVLCENCGMAVHDFIAQQLQAKHLG